MNYAQKLRELREEKELYQKDIEYYSKLLCAV